MPRRCTATSCLALLALALPLQSCRQVLGVPEEGVGCGSFAFGADGGAAGCASCASANCCGQLSSCAADQGCLTYESCLGNCGGEPGCRASCTAQDYGIAASTSVSALSACLASHCENECGLTCGGAAGYVTDTQSAAECQKCIQGDLVCNDARAWTRSPDGDAYWRCVMNAVTPDGRHACARAHPSGKVLFDKFQPDYSGTCGVACNYGGYWACVGNVSWPKPSTDALLEGGATASVKFSFSVFDPSQRTTLPGASVAICQNCPCSGTDNINPAWWMGLADDAGVVSGTETYGLMAGFGLDGCMEVTSPPSGQPALVPTFCYWGYPLSESTAGASGNEGCRVESATQASEIALAVPYTLDTTRSYAVAATVYDCLGSLAPNVSLSLDPPPDMDSHPFFGLSSGNLQRMVTDQTGVGGFLNVAIGANVPDGGTTGEGTATITATPLAPDGGRMNVSSKLTVTIQAGTVTEVMMFPTPPH